MEKKENNKNEQTRIKIENYQEPEVRIDFQNEINERIDEETWKALRINEDVEGAWTMLRDIIIKTAIEVCSTAVEGRKSGDTWWNDEIKTAQKEKKEAYKRTLNMTGLSDEEREK